MSGFPGIEFVLPVRAAVKIGERSFALGPVQWRMMQLLATGGVISAEEFHRKIYGRRVIGNKNLLSAHICLLNQCIKGSGIRIANRKGSGWFLAGERTA